jgi:two-component sensor histidine kinase
MARAADLWRLDREMTDTALLLVSELVTNAIRHGTPPVRLSLRLDRERLRVEVTDSSPVLPELTRPDPDQIGGRGLQIVQLLAARWGASASSRRLGKTVWFELSKMLR